MSILYLYWKHIFVYIWKESGKANKELHIFSTTVQKLYTNDEGPCFFLQKNIRSRSA